MRLQRLLQLLPAGLAALVLLEMGMLLVQERQSRAAFTRMRAAQAERNLFGAIRARCEPLTFKAVAWTLTRRTTQARQYQDGKAACLASVVDARQAVPHADAALNDLERQIGSLAGLLETIQAEHTDETKMVTVGRLEREVQPIGAQMLQRLDGLVRAADEESARLMDASLAQQSRTLWLGSLAGLTAVLLGAALVRRASRRIVRGVDDAVAMSRALAEGDLGVAPVAAGQDEIGQLVAAMDKARRAWIVTIGEIHAVTQRIADAADGIARDAGALNERSVHAAGNLQETARTMGDLLAVVESSTEAARRAAELAAEASGSAQDGKRAVAEVVRTMDGLNAASARIGEIVGVIDGIAFQTNLLALNAAVEAARAGEQGRGFAVVASEVRALARRSSQAAGEIRGIIGKSVAGVQDGARSAAGASERIVHMGTSVEQVSAMIADVSGAAGRQSGELDQLARSVDEVDRVIQHNARLVGTWTERARDLREELERLASLVRRFRLPRPERLGA